MKTLGRPSPLSTQDVVERYKSGERVADIAADCGVTKAAVYMRLRRGGAKLAPQGRPRKIPSDSTREDGCPPRAELEDALSRWNMAEVAQEYDVDLADVSRWMRYFEL